jgi:hypothetical protein
MNLVPKFRKSLRQKYCVRFRTNHPDQSDYDGIVTHIRPDYIVVREEYDFELEGIVVFSRKAVVACEERRCGKTFNEVLRHTGQMKDLKIPAWLDECCTFQDILGQLKKRRIWPAVEIVQKKDTWFLVGPITHVEENGSLIRGYSADGKWGRDYPINYRYLHCIRFGDRYTRHFNRYMRDKKPQP